MTDLHAVALEALRTNGFTPTLDAASRAELAALRPSVDTIGARDLRALLWSSIDNAESKDLDQIVFTEELPDKANRLLVGVADVDVLVTRGSALDQHAMANATSVYVYRALATNKAKLAHHSVGGWLEGRGPVPSLVAQTPGLEAQLWLQDRIASQLKPRTSQSRSISRSSNGQRSGGWCVSQSGGTASWTSRRRTASHCPSRLTRSHSPMFSLCGGRRIRSASRTCRSAS